MLYHLRQGKAEEGIIEQARRLKRPIPANILNAPVLYMGLELYYDAFCHLNTTRSVGFGVGPIPWTAVTDYAEKKGLSPEQAEDLEFFIGEMDLAFREYNAEQLEKEKKSGSKGKGLVGRLGRKK